MVGVGAIGFKFLRKREPIVDRRRSVCEVGEQRGVLRVVIAFKDQVAKCQHVLVVKHSPEVWQHLRCTNACHYVATLRSASQTISLRRQICQ